MHPQHQREWSHQRWQPELAPPRAAAQQASRFRCVICRASLLHGKAWLGWPQGGGGGNIASALTPRRSHPHGAACSRGPHGGHAQGPCCLYCQPTSISNSHMVHRHATTARCVYVKAPCTAHEPAPHYATNLYLPYGPSHITSPLQRVQAPAHSKLTRPALTYPPPPPLHTGVPAPSPPGEVFLVGTGPGDPGLLTLRAVQLMQHADVVLYDRLVSEEILRLVHPGARMVSATCWSDVGGRRCVCAGGQGAGAVWGQGLFQVRNPLVTGLSMRAILTMCLSHLFSVCRCMWGRRLGTTQHPRKRFMRCFCSLPARAPWWCASKGATLMSLAGEAVAGG